MTVILRSFLRYLPRRRVLSLLHLLGIASGVATVVGMHLTSQSALHSFLQGVDFLRGEATHSLRRAAGPMGEALLAGLMEDPAVLSFSPVVEGRIRLKGGGLARLLGVDPFLDRTVHPAFYQSLPREGGRERLLPFLLEDDLVLAGTPSRGTEGPSPDEVLETSAGRLRVAGAFANPTGDEIFVMDIAHAQERLGKRGTIDRVDLVLSDEEGFRRRWAEGYVVMTVGEQRARLAGMLKAFRLNLGALSLMSLFVGIFLIYNTTMFAVLSRRRDSGILRSLGARRREIAAAFLAEIALLGGAGGFFGGAFGYVLSHFLGKIVGRTISDLYAFLRPSPLPWSWSYPAAGMVLGVTAGLLGAAWPLVQLLRSDPAAALQGRVPSGTSRGNIWSAALCGGGLAAAGMSVLLARTPPVALGFGSAFAVLGGLSLCAGSAVILLHPPLRALFGVATGLPGRVAAGVIRRNIGRTAVAAAAFMTALSLTVGMGIMIDSFRRSLRSWMEGQLRGDLYVGSSPEIRIPEGFTEEVRAVGGVGGVDRYTNREAVYQGTVVRIAAVDAEVLGRFADFSWLEGSDASWEALPEGAVIVSESFARRFPRAKDGVLLETVGGRSFFPLAGIFVDYSTEHGLIMMDRAHFELAFEDRTVDSLGVFLLPGTPEPEAAISRVLELARSRGLPSWRREEFFTRILRVFDSTFAVTRSMRLLAVVTALFGIAGALLSLFMERRREYGVYRALGFSAPQVAVMTLLEGLGIAATSFILCIPAGTGLALLLVRVINVQSFNWSVSFTLSLEPYLAAAATAAAAGLAAALYPSWRVLRTYPTMQLRGD